MLTYEDIKNDKDIRNYIEMSGNVLTAIGFTEHSFAHVTRVAETAGYILETLGFDERTVELGKIGDICTISAMLLTETVMPTAEPYLLFLSSVKEEWTLKMFP